MRGLIIKVSGSSCHRHDFASKAGVGGGGGGGRRVRKGVLPLSLEGGSGASPGVSGKQSEALLSPG